jgi:hypothetical protein
LGAALPPCIGTRWRLRLVLIVGGQPFLQDFRRIRSISILNGL